MRNHYKSSAARCIFVAVATALCLSSPPAQLRAQGAGLYRAVVTIPTPHSANLLHLRGLGGRGTARIQVGQTCYKLPVRFVAGDFSGETVQLTQSAPIVIELRDPDAVASLLSGEDIVSSETPSVIVHSGILADTGFVINPGRNITADIFGVRVSDIPCASPGTSAAQLDQ